MEPDREKLQRVVWEIERRLSEDNVRPVIFCAGVHNHPTGYRLATSNGGVLTGRGADLILIQPF